MTKSTQILIADSNVYLYIKPGSNIIEEVSEEYDDTEVLITIFSDKIEVKNYETGKYREVKI